MSKPGAVFLDRDGTISEEVGYINHPSRLMIYPWAYEALRLFNKAGILTIVVTNQAGVARGYFDEQLVNKINEKLRAEVESHQARVDAIYYCPHHPEAGRPPYRQNCLCRKPKPGMALKAAEEFGLDLTKSFVAGDRYGDMQLAQTIGARSVLLLTGYGRGEYEYRRHAWPAPPDHVAENLLAAAHWILSQYRPMV